ncbi:hypothetical protein [Streptomyces sp. NPDC057729]|uniref:hypothetical protein n=1 Tax=Streptomyces sp. NPDC057729 TaxID=3346230 RepID=UPI0036AAC9DF
MPRPSGVLRYLMTAFSARMADEGMAVAVVMLAAYRTGSAAQGAFVLTAWMAPHVLAAPLTGAVAARARRLRLFYVGALGGFALAISALAMSIGRVPLPVVLAVAAAGGCCGPAVSGGLSSLITRLLPAGAERDRAYSWDAVISTQPPSPAREPPDWSPQRSPRPRPCSCCRQPRPVPRH